MKGSREGNNVGLGNRVSASTSASASSMSSVDGYRGKKGGYDVHKNTAQNAFVHVQRKETGNVTIVILYG